MLHGGVLFALLDDAAGWATRFSGVRCVTAKAEIRYRKNVPTDASLLISARNTKRG
jgi:acyl-coenzyme A thioesterase PaaI-like protein